MPKHAITLATIHKEPIRGDIDWSDIAAMLDYFGADINDGGNGRVRVHLAGFRAVFQRPEDDHASKLMIRSVRRFLKSAGIEP